MRCFDSSLESGLIKPTVAAGLISKCGKNTILINALHNSLAEVFQRAESEAERARKRNARKGKRLGPKAITLTDPKNQIKETWANSGDVACG